MTLLVTVTLTPPGAKPVAVPLIVVPPGATPVAVKAPLVWPALIVSVPGVTVAKPVGFVVRVTLTPPAGAAEGSVTVPPIVRPTPTSGPIVVRTTPLIGVTVTVAVLLAALGSVGVDAVRVAVLV